MLVIWFGWCLKLFQLILTYISSEFVEAVSSKMLHAITPSLSVVSSQTSTSKSAEIQIADPAASDVEGDVTSRYRNLSSTLNKLHLWEKKLYQEVKVMFSFVGSLYFFSLFTLWCFGRHLLLEGWVYWSVLLALWIAQLIRGFKIVSSSVIIVSFCVLVCLASGN